MRRLNAWLRDPGVFDALFILVSLVLAVMGWARGEVFVAVCWTLAASIGLARVLLWARFRRQ